MKKTIFICTAWVFLSSCANINSIHRQRTLSSGPDHNLSYVSVDAKQRLVLSAFSNKQLKVCAEYMPDIFSVLSSSLSGQAVYGLGEDTKDVSLKVAQALSESGATIRRSQTVNLLALSMYKTCERFLSGAINENEMIIQAVRDQRMLVSVLAIEQLTGVAQLPAPVIVNSGATLASTETSAVQILEKAKDQADVQRDLTVTAQKTYEEHLKDLPSPADGKAKTCDLNAMLRTYFGPKFRTYPVQVLSKDAAPKTTEIRYFFDQDRSIARNISIALNKPLKGAPPCTKIPGYEKTVKAGVLELWIAEHTQIGDSTPESALSFATPGGVGCTGQ